MSGPVTFADILAGMRSNPFYNPFYLPELREANKAVREMADRLEAAHKCEMDEAATFINKYLEDSALDPKAHSWLIRNGYQDTSYQADTFGQEIVKEGGETCKS